MLEEEIGFIPFGSMNFALADKVYRNGYPIIAWCHGEESFQFFQKTREIKQLPDLKFPDGSGIRITTDIQEALENRKIIFVTPPSWFLRDTLEQAAPYISSDAILVCGTKGFDEYKGKFYTPSQVIEQIIPNSHNRLAVVSGPNFAGQIFRGITTATMVAAHKRRISQAVKEVLSSNNNGESKDFLVRIYNGNPQDVEIVGAFKNVVGLVMGFVRTLEHYGENTGASILPQSLYEAAVLCKKMGRSSRAVWQLPGVGDMSLLMNSKSSRNVEAGENFGNGIWDLNYLLDPNHTIEGVRTVKAVRWLVGRHIRAMPLAAYAYEILYGGMNPQQATRDFLAGKLPQISPIA